MPVNLVVGAPRNGKSNYCRALITQKDTINKPCYVFDPRGEYGDTYMTLINGSVKQVKGVGLVANRPDFLRSRYIGDENGVSKEFFKEIAKKKRGANIIWEEMTGFLRGKIPDDINDMLTGVFHTFNTHTLVFHSLGTIPPDLIRNSSCNNIILFKTLDSAEEIDNKFHNPVLNYGLKKQMAKANKAEPTIINILEGIIDGVPFEKISK